MVALAFFNLIKGNSCSASREIESNPSVEGQSTDDRKQKQCVGGTTFKASARPKPYLAVAVGL
jgi:hypothetical protein